MFTIEKAKSGELTLLFNGKSIHSKYAPKAEAVTFLNKQTIKKSSRLFLLLGPGLGYLKLAILKAFPNAKILSIHMDQYIFEHSLKLGENWTYGDKTSLSYKLSSFISDFQILETQIIKWKPCTNLFPTRLEDIEAKIQQFYKERKGTIFTTGAFGNAWIRNIQYNYEKSNKYKFIKNIDSTIIIAASGPTLKEDMDLLKLNRDKYILAALPSSLSALNHAQIIPDFIFHTDPGYWAKEHLKLINNNSIPIIMPLTASFYFKITNPVILFNQGSYIENYLLKQLFITIPPHGTVAGTAYLFFRQITSKPIIFMGLDFSYKDIEEHVNPHSFDILYLSKQNRFLGYLHLLYEKHQSFVINTKDLNTNQAFLTYSGWFNNENRINTAFRFNPSSVKTKGLTPISALQLAGIVTSSNNFYTLLDISIDSKNLLTHTNIKKLFNDLLDLIIRFEQNINSFNEESILNFFTQPGLLLEFLQYTDYSDIIELAHNYKTDINKSKDILNKIYSKSFNYISYLIERYNYGR